jgi:hypothetical protein
MASWENWMPELVLAAPTAPAPLIYQCLNRSAREFLRQTRAWQEWLDPTQVTGEAFKEYEFELPQGAELLRLERATLNGRPLEVANARDVPADPWKYAQKGRAYLVSTDLQDFTVGSCSGTGLVQVYVSLLPGIRGSTVPDSIAVRYHEAIREGAKAALLNTSGTEYYQPDQAGVALGFFRQAVDDAAADVWRSSTGRVSRGRAVWL